MRRFLLVLVAVCLMCGSVAAATVRFEAVKLDEQTKMAPNQGSLFQITYQVDDVLFPSNREIDIKFDAAVYAMLESPVGPANFDILILQPNNPPGTDGDFSALALLAFPFDPVEFSVIVRMAGSHQPSPQDFVINQLDENGLILSEVSSGQTIQSGVPEPATAPLVVAVLLALCSVAAVRRARRSAV